MRRAVLFVSVLAMLAACPGAGHGDAVRVLFVGNSLTYYNDLPGMTEALRSVLEPRRPLEADMLAAGGASMLDHVEGGALQRVLSDAAFDVVVLQEIGGWPPCPPVHPACPRSISSLREAIALVRASRARPIWYSTWQVVPEYQRMQSERAAELASELGVETADVGAALAAWRRAHGGEDLLLEDGHPDTLGSWIAAALILRVMAGSELPEDIRLEQACRTPWQGAAPARDRLASEQRAPGLKCGVPAPDRLANILRLVNELER